MALDFRVIASESRDRIEEVTCVSITEHTVKTDQHTSFYLAAGPEDGPLVIFVHGWPELSISWRHQLPALAALGFRAIAPDMRGYGRSSVYGKHDDYAQELIVRDMIELLDSTGRAKAVWVGHDWGSPFVGMSRAIIPIDAKRWRVCAFLISPSIAVSSTR